jgi:anti-sigma B factor antagonist
VPLTFRLSSAELTDDTFIVTVSGEADALAAPELQRELDVLAEDGARELIVDLLQVPFLDSTILGVLLGTARRIRADGGDVVLISDDPRVLRTFEISGLVSSFRFERTLNAAVDRVLQDAVSQ